MTGMIQGGWEFVYAAYGITGAAMVLYGISLFVRLRQADNAGNAVATIVPQNSEGQHGDDAATNEDDRA